MKDTKIALEFDQIENKLLPFFALEDNRDIFSEGQMITDSSHLESEHALLSEILEYYRLGYSINLEKTPCLVDHMMILSKEGDLTIKGLSNMKSLLVNVDVFKKSLGSKDKLEKLHLLSEGLTSFTYLANLLQRSILPDLTIADDASGNLLDIRTKIKHISNQFNNAIKNAALKYKDHLTQNQEVMKEGLPTLAVKANSKAKVKGLVADTSNSGETIYIIPLEVLDIQNKLFTLKEDEQEEIKRILKSLTSMLFQHLNEIQQNYRITLILDSLFGRVRFGLTYHGTVAANSDHIYLEDLAHPLLNQDTVVRNTFSLNNNSKILIISGPNAGGKTVLIKAISVACYMNQRGLLVDCLGKAELRLFHDIFFLSGDSQSIMDNLSTFSGHIKSINDALAKIFNDSLFVVDEIGQGTSPLDGEAIGIGVVNFLKKVGCFSILTSHYDGLKQKAVEDDSCAVGAMIFDETTIKPTFKYQEGMLGKSYAIEVSQSLGLNEDILNSAKQYIKDQKSTPEKEGLEKIQELQAINEKLNREYDLKLKKLDEVLDKREKALLSLKEEKQSLYDKANQKVDAIIEQKIAEIDAAYKSNEINFSLGEMAKIKGELNKIGTKKQVANQSETIEKKHKFIKGDRVKVESMNNSGLITDIDKNNVSVDLGGLVIKTKINDVSFLSKDASKKIKKVYTPDKYMAAKTGVGLECNIIGLYAEEAEEVVEKYLSDCLLMKYRQVRIVHGNGSGILRQMVWELLKNKKYVKSFRYGGAGEGGLGATVVDLK
jgi:DNA mismatch repair protein MutS2